MSWSGVLRSIKCKNSSMFLLINAVNTLIVLMFSITRDISCTLSKPYETNCDLWIWALQRKYVWRPSGRVWKSFSFLAGLQKQNIHSVTWWRVCLHDRDVSCFARNQVSRWRLPSIENCRRSRCAFSLLWGWSFAGRARLYMSLIHVDSVNHVNKKIQIHCLFHWAVGCCTRCWLIRAVLSFLRVCFWWNM